MRANSSAVDVVNGAAPRAGELAGLRAVLISTYELGHQPFGLASPATWLASAGATVTSMDLAVTSLDEAAVAGAHLVAFYVPMHTATRLAAALVERVRRLNRTAHLCFYGLYAAMNEPYLRSLGAATVLGGEFEDGLLALARRLCSAPTTAPAIQPEPVVSLARQRFLVPDRRALPPLAQYARVVLPDGRSRVAGYTEATRGCMHLCRHCPIPPVYHGVLRVVPPDVVLADCARQVDAGAQHITFGDPDFFNGPGHALRVVGTLHRRFPAVSYDVTIKVEHLLQHADHLTTLRDTGCLFVTSAVEAVADDVLRIFAKGHTRADFARAVALCREAGLTLNPTFVAVTPWTTLEGYRDLLATVLDLGLVDNVAPIQYGIRLLIPAGSLLLDLPAVRDLAGTFDQEALCYPWRHPDPRLDDRCTDVLAAVRAGQRADETRRAIFRRIWELAVGEDDQARARQVRMLATHPAPAATPVPHLSEPWYC